MRFDNRLLFCLCRACAKTFDINTDNTLTSIRWMDENGELKEYHTVDEVCKHSDEDRSFVTVVDHDELAFALERGYKVTHIYNAMVWPEVDAQGQPRWTTDMFKGFH